jgi:hypothetical protein
MMRALLVSLITVFLASCSGVGKIGAIAHKDFYSVNANNVWSKSHSMVVVHDTKAGTVIPASTGVGTGFIADLWGGAAGAASAYLWGASLRPDEYEDNSSTSVGGGSANQAQGQLQGQHSSSSSNSNANAKNKNANLNLNSNHNKNHNHLKNSNKNLNKNSGGDNVRQNGGGRGGNHNN